MNINSTLLFRYMERRLREKGYDLIERYIPIHEEVITDIFKNWNLIGTVYRPVYDTRISVIMNQGITNLDNEDRLDKLHCWLRQFDYV